MDNKADDIFDRQRHHSEAHFAQINLQRELDDRIMDFVFSLIDTRGIRLSGHVRGLNES